MESFAPWLAVAISAATLVYTIYSARSKAAAAKLATVEQNVSRIGDRVDALEDRATKIESDMRHLPDTDTTQRLELSLRDLRAEVQVLAERIKPVAAISARLQETLLERAAP